MQKNRRKTKTETEVYYIFYRKKHHDEIMVERDELRVGHEFKKDVI